MKYSRAVEVKTQGEDEEETPQHAAAGLSCTPLFLISFSILSDRSVSAAPQTNEGVGQSDPLTLR